MRIVRYDEAEKAVITDIEYVAVTMEVCRETRPLANVIGTESLSELP